MKNLDCVCWKNISCMFTKLFPKPRYNVAVANKVSSFAGQIKLSTAILFAEFEFDCNQNSNQPKSLFSWSQLNRLEPMGLISCARTTATEPVGTESNETWIFSITIHWSVAWYPGHTILQTFCVKRSRIRYFFPSATTVTSGELLSSSSTTNLSTAKTLQHIFAARIQDYATRSYSESHQQLPKNFRRGKWSECFLR